ncbi:MAG: outer membrane beta-barrel protein [Bacteroidota bacterium]
MKDRTRRRTVQSGIWVLPLLALLLMVPMEQTVAQTGIGASFENRDTSPENGFGLRIEQGILNMVPLVDLKVRGHFSYFSEEVNSFEFGNATATAELDSYDFGVAATGGVPLGLLSPYAGLGIGSESLKAVEQGAESGEFDEDYFYWNVLTGIKMTALPMLKPFVEYRFVRHFEDDQFYSNQNSRWAFGVTLEF